MIKDQKGQSLVEFALVLPLLLLLICGIVDLGRLLFAYSSLNMTAQEAVRLGGLGKTDAEITDYAKSHLVIGDPSKLTVTITPQDSTRKSGQNVTVSLSCPLPFITPLMSKIIPAPVLSTNSTIRVE
ncbi:pilus assembly protein [Cohnella sp. CFH 77786]|uniref:TadE/TadG family type IV pilus assembly protein n=1 Tax=Cohnella sp. CFH 77786 TaxID=2662265 RepID=UPI001C60FB47|nr:TadE/TadG family type IV pilus assembly protein [Cohnella sp. CFH 77786]MBW5447514.1 pilus assembly protein [Cohnella sp. CFH 77786]